MTDPLAAILDHADERTLDRLAELLAPRLQRIARPSRNHGWLDTSAAAGYLGISKHALHRLTSERRIPFTQDAPGARCYFRRSDIDSWREASARGPR